VNDLAAKIKQALFTFYLIALHAAAAFFAISYFFPDLMPVRTTTIPNVADPTVSTPAPTPLAVPTLSETNTGPLEESVVPDAPASVLMIPVKGVKRSELIDTFSETRGTERRHDAIDIIAPAGTPVLAVADGEIVKFFDSEAGGITIYQMSVDRRYVYYYAHLQRRADDVKEHDVVPRGKVIGYVGDTGNAGGGNYHLHFAISLPSDPKRFWGGTYINPYPLLQNGIESP
jgi:murein DD-endopeptidase MepM/ murein hydrolase activator NlpD